MFGEDNESQSYYQQISDMLLSAGYFRARIPGITPFDKILGGMTWSITASNVDVDIDFKDDLNLGQKIKLSEVIVSALKNMRCPHKLEPHQIQGLDYVKVFPVIQWLVKKVIETREETFDQNRLLSNHTYNEGYNKTIFGGADENSKEEVQRMIKKYEPARVLKRKRNTAVASTDVRSVYSVLVEYGDKGAIRVLKSQDGEDPLQTAEVIAANAETDGKRTDSGVLKNMPFGKKVDTEKDIKAGSEATTIGKGNKSNELGEKSEQNKETKVNGGQKKEGADSADENEDYKEYYAENLLTDKLVGENLGKIVSENVDDMKEVYQEFLEEQAKEEGSDELMMWQEEKERHEKAIANLKLKIKQQQEKLIVLEMSTQETTANLNIAEGRLKEEQVYTDKLEDAMEALNETLQGEDVHEGQMAGLEEKITEREGLKDKKKQFRADCKAKLEELERREKELIDLYEQDFKENKSWYEEIDRSHTKQSTKLHDGRVALAQLNQEVAVLQRKIENIPSRIELSQYQKRFFELYEAINTKLEENRKCYNSYNTLSEKKRVLAQQVELLKSFHQGFSQSKSKSEKENFCKKFTETVAVVKESETKTNDKLRQLKDQEDALQQKHNDIQSVERQYFQIIKDFQHECNINEELIKRKESQQRGE
mmetsp:Transcript_43286/g.49771  ORF Transcript_43286/g.49771 Transcript_43286/m.49771 type:complete len:653 (+) Transcript_43286:32-1990(+)